jgi:hypothetical protein
MGGHDQAIEQAQSRYLHASRFSDAVENGGDFFQRVLPLPKIIRSPKEATASNSEINSSIVAVAVVSMESRGACKDALAKNRNKRGN